MHVNKSMQYLETDMGVQVNPRMVEATGGFLPMDDIIKGKIPKAFIKFSSEIEI